MHRAFIGAAATASVPYPAMSPDTLVACLKGEVDLAPWLAQLHVVFDEFSTQRLAEAVSADGLPIAKVRDAYLARFAVKPEPIPEVEEWLARMGAPVRAGRPAA